MLNNISIIGRLCADPELRKTTSGTMVGSFRIANDQGKGPNGEKIAIFISCSVFGKQSDTLVKFFRKGDLIGLSGRLTQRKYTNKDGVDVTSTEIIADRIDFVTSKGENQTEKAEPAEAPAEAPAKNKEKAGSKNLDQIDVVDDDLPF